MNMQTIKTGISSIAVFLLAMGMAASAQAQQGQQQPPAEYYQLMGRANYAFEHAKNKADYEEAVKLFQQAVNAAPWLPDTYYDLGKAQQKAEQYNDAIGSLQRYLQLKPDANDRDKVNAEIEEIQGEAQQAAAQPAIEQQNQQQSDADFIASLNGARYSKARAGSEENHDDLVIQGNQLISESYAVGYVGPQNVQSSQIEGRKVEWPMSASYCTEDFGAADCKVIATIQRDYIEADWYAGGTRVPDNFVSQGGIHFDPQVYKRVQ